MAAATLDVVGIGNAIVDVITQADEAFLTQQRLVKGSMQLIDAERAETLYGAMGPGLEMSGGAAGNTMAGVASLGGKAAYIGKVRNPDRCRPATMTPTGPRPALSRASRS